MISSNFQDEIKQIIKKYETAGYPTRFVKSVVKAFQDKKSKTTESKTQKVMQTKNHFFLFESTTARKVKR